MTQAVYGETVRLSILKFGFVAHTVGMLGALACFYLANLLKGKLLQDLDRKRIFKVFLALTGASIVVKTPEMSLVLSKIKVVGVVFLTTIHVSALGLVPTVLLARTSWRRTPQQSAMALAFLNHTQRTKSANPVDFVA